jgi:hypothetical protein
MNIEQIVSAPSGLVAVFEDEAGQEQREPVFWAALVRNGRGFQEVKLVSIDLETANIHIVEQCRIEYQPTRP